MCPLEDGTFAGAIPSAYSLLPTKTPASGLVEFGKRARTNSACSANRRAPRPLSKSHPEIEQRAFPSSPTGKRTVVVLVRWHGTIRPDRQPGNLLFGRLPGGCSSRISWKSGAGRYRRRCGTRRSGHLKCRGDEVQDTRGYDICEGGQPRHDNTDLQRRSLPLLRMTSRKRGLRRGVSVGLDGVRYGGRFSTSPAHRCYALFGPAGELSESMDSSPVPAATRAAAAGIRAVDRPATVTIVEPPV